MSVVHPSTGVTETLFAVVADAQDGKSSEGEAQPRKRCANARAWLGRSGDYHGNIYGETIQ